MRYFAGIDPGASGAMAIVREDEAEISFVDYDKDLRSLAWNALQLPIAMAVLEKVHAMPKQGVTSMFNFGKNLGHWEMLLASNRIPYMEITPQRWRKLYDSAVPPKPSKNDLRLYTLRRWPQAAESLKRVKDDGRAEALLMAVFAKTLSS
jgi:hypothetical protein